MKNILFTTPQDAEAAFYEAIEKADLDAMMAVWADDEEIVCVHPGGVRLAGMAQVRESWRQIFAGGQSLRFRLRNQQALTGMTLVIHSVYEQISVAGEARPRTPVIATNIYLHTERGWRMVVHERGWRMVVHHASSAPASPDSESKRAPKTLH
jgi:ketosteroid isomerase-like protein